LNRISTTALVALVLLSVPPRANAQTTTFSYDDNGNLTTRTVGGVATEFVFDARDRLVEVRQDTHILARFQYDWMGRLSKKIGTPGIRQFVYDADSTQVLAEYDENGVLIARYSWAGRRLNTIQTSAGVFHPLFDALGSVVSLVDEDGNVAATYHYDAWGQYRFPEELAAHPNRYGFTGHRWQQETGLYYANARHLDPGLGRFTSADPYPSEPGDPPTLHRYTYARNAPTRYTDPLGLYEWDESLGGSKTDAELRQEGEADRSLRRTNRQILEQREAFRYGLREASGARDALPEGEDRARVTRAIAAYGEEGDPPLEDTVELPAGGRVRYVRRTVVGAEAAADPRIRGETGSPPPTASYDESSGELRYGMTTRVAINPNALRKEPALARTVAHEGSHAADYQGLQAAIVTETREGTGAAPAIGNPSVDLTQLETEQEAYRVTAAVAQGQAAQGGPLQQGRPAPGITVFGGRQPGSGRLTVEAGQRPFVIWDPQWTAEERAAKRDAAINEFLAVGRPAGVYGLTPEDPGRRLSGQEVDR
jgi:RHS repeat-associated protein